MALRLLARARRAVFSLISSLLKFFASAILVAVVAVVAVLAMPHLHSWAQTLSGAAQLASSLMYNTCTSHTCRLILLGSPVSSGIAAVLTVRQAWAWLNKDKKRIAMLEQTIRQLRADKNSLSFQVTQLRADLQQAQDKVRELLVAPEVRPLAALNRLGLPSRASGRNAAAAPVLALVHVPTVAEVLLGSDLPVPLAVGHIAGYLQENGEQLSAFMGAPFFGMGTSTDLFNGSATLSRDVKAKGNAVALALVAARDAGVRRQLKTALVPAYTGERGADGSTDWVALSRRLFQSKQWAEQGKGKGAAIRDVLQYVMGAELAGYWKYERVAAALMLGLLMREGVMV